MPFTDTFREFTQQLSSAVRLGQAAGLSRGEMVEKAQEIGNWLAREADPRTPEQRLLKELWTVADGSEKEAMASALLKLIQRQGR